MGTKEILYKLIQVSLGSISTFDLPKEVDWNGLIDISLEQGVCAVVQRSAMTLPVFSLFLPT